MDVAPLEMHLSIKSSIEDCVLHGQLTIYVQGPLIDLLADLMTSIDVFVAAS